MARDVTAPSLQSEITALQRRIEALENLPGPSGEFQQFPATMTLEGARSPFIQYSAHTFEYWRADVSGIDLPYVYAEMIVSSWKKTYSGKWWNKFNSLNPTACYLSMNCPLTGRSTAELVVSGPTTDEDFAKIGRPFAFFLEHELPIGWTQPGKHPYVRCQQRLNREFPLWELCQGMAGEVIDRSTTGTGSLNYETLVHQTVYFHQAFFHVNAGSTCAFAGRSPSFVRGASVPHLGVTAKPVWARVFDTTVEYFDAPRWYSTPDRYTEYDPHDLNEFGMPITNGGE